MPERGEMTYVTRKLHRSHQSCMAARTENSVSKRRFSRSGSLSAAEKPRRFRRPDYVLDCVVEWRKHLETLFAQGFRALRQKKALSQSELAQRSGVSLRALAYWEAGTCLPRIPELQSTLNALEATPEEAAQVIGLLETPRALRLTQTERKNADAGGIAGAGIGDLLRAMRMRRRMTQAELAERLRVTRQSVIRWESRQNFVGEENLERLCALLGAAPEERRALREHRLVMPRWDADEWSKVTIEEAAHLWRETQRPHHILAPDYRPQSPLFDLEVLALKRHLHCHAKPDAAARRLLANIETDHALWLHFEQREAEAKASAFRALHLIEEETVPQDFWGELLNLAASGGYLAKARGGHLTSLRVIEQWLPRLPAGFVRTQQLCDIALYTAQLGHRSKAMALMEAAARSMDRAGAVSAAETFYYAVTMERVNLTAGNTIEISDDLMTHCPNDFQRIHVFLLWTQTLQYHGERQAASRYLAQAQALRTPEIPQRLRQLVTDYALRM